MKKLLLSTLLLLSFNILLLGQAWQENFPQDKVQNGTLTFYEIQKAFNDYCEALNVENGYYYVNGEKLKMGGWKQFKRWEWFWETRVDATTGEFPNTSAYEEFQKYLKDNPEAKSSSGNWTSMGPSLTSGGYAGLGRLNCIGFRPGDNNTYYVGSPSGGIWKTTNGASSWTTLGDGNAVIGVSDIVVIAGATTATDVVYIATGDRDAADNYSVGVLKSTDGGNTWSNTGLNWSASNGRRISRLLMDPTNNNVLYAATTIGLYKTTNAGASWSQIFSTSFIDLEFKPGNSTYLYGSTTGGTIYRSTNSGSSFSSVLSTGQARTELAVTAANSSLVYAVVANSSSGLYGIYSSTNSGGSFSQVFSGTTTNLLNWDCNSTSSGGQGWYDLTIIADPNSANTVFVGGVNTWKSTNGGSNWSISNHWSGTCSGSATNVHADKHFFAYQNGTSTLFECNDGGLYKTSNAGSTWAHLGNGLVTSQIYRMGVAQTASDEIIIGLQDNGTKAMLSGNWNDVLGGDGMDCAIDHTNHNIQYGELYYGQIYRTTNHWGSYSSIQSGLSGSGAWVAPFVIDPTTASTVYIGKQDLFKSTNYGSGWTQLSSWGGNTLRSIAVAPSNSNYIYTATTGTLYKTTNGGTSWSTITGTLPTGSASISFISVKNNDPNTVWVSMSGYNSYGVYQTTNGGTSWTNISTGLPSIPVNCVIQNKQNAAQVELYAGTEVGVYMKLGSANWAPFYSGMPNVVVTEVEIYYDATQTNSRIRAATYGRGVWESDLHSAPAAPVTEFSADDVTPLVGQTVTFTDLSSNAPTSWVWSFSPPTVTYVGGTNSSSQNPQVQFTNNGIYAVSLTTGNGVGSDNETKTAYIHAGTPGMWTGLATQDWNTGSNWHNYLVPASSQDVTIPASPFSWPVYNGNLTLGTICRDITMDGASEMTVLGDLTIPSGRTLTCNANNLIFVEGNWTNNGNFVEGTGTVEFIGTSSSSISGKIEKHGYGGKLDNTGGGANFTYDQYLIFDAYEAFTIVSVKVYANGAGTRTIVLEESDGTIIQSVPVNIPDGEQTVTLNINVPVGQDMHLRIPSGTRNLYRNDNGVSYPYAIGDVGSITGSSASSSGYYYFFYNIEYYVEGEPETFNNLNISKTINPATTNGNINVVNDLTVAPDAYFTIDNENSVDVAGDLLLDANTSGKASLIDNGILTVGGTTSVRSYYVDNRWHFLSSPVSNAESYLFLDIYLKTWHEDTYLWEYIIATDYDLLPGTGYEIWSNLGNPTIDYTGGTLNTGNFNIPITATDRGGVSGIGTDEDEGWNFVGNPYPSGIDLGAPGNVLPAFTWTNIDYTVYLWNGVQYASYNPFSGIGHNGGTRYIPSMQSFFIRANDFNPGIMIPNSARMHTAQSNYKNSWQGQLLNLIVEGNGYSDEIMVLTDDQATKDFDSRFDAYKMWGIDEAPQLYSLSSGVKYGVNVLPQILDEDIIPVGLRVVEENEYIISLAELRQFENYKGVWLEDLKSGIIVDLLESPTYSFISEPGDEEQRFLIHFMYPQTSNSGNSDISIYSFNDMVYAKSYGSPIKSLEIYDMLGHKVINLENLNIEEVEVEMDSGMGYYLVKVFTDTGINTEKVFIR